jgi:hypothetical protein
MKIYENFAIYQFLKIGIKKNGMKGWMDQQGQGGGRQLVGTKFLVSYLD